MGAQNNLPLSRCVCARTCMISSQLLVARSVIGGARASVGTSTIFSRDTRWCVCLKSDGYTRGVT